LERAAISDFSRQADFVSFQIVWEKLLGAKRQRRSEGEQSKTKQNFCAYPWILRSTPWTKTRVDLY